MRSHGGRWLGAVEGYYGPPLAPDARLDLVRWMGPQGFNCYVYSPKHDPYHRAQWREPYPEDRMADGDEEALAAKLRSFRDLGATVLGVAWDDVPPGGTELGGSHGRAVAHAVEAIGSGVDWITCPTDYSGTEVTPYLRAYTDALPEAAEILWTGPSIVSPFVTAAQARRFGEELGRPVLFAENFPVNDGAMAGVLHLGPYPRREAGVVDATSGVLCNFMSLPLASRVGLGVAARWWRDPTGDREAQWRDAIREVPGIRPLAHASRSWVGEAEPDPQLVHWVDEALDGRPDDLRTYLVAGCRQGLAADWIEELEPWLTQWDFEVQAMQFALAVLEARPRRPTSLAFLLSEFWGRARASKLQLFGIRWAYYPVTVRDGDQFDALPDALVEGDNLTDRLCRTALTT
jgi:hypothetical protein